MAVRFCIMLMLLLREVWRQAAQGGFEGSPPYPLCHKDPSSCLFFHTVCLLHVDVLSTCLLPHGYKMAATALDITSSITKVSKSEGENGWVKRALSFFREGKPPFKPIALCMSSARTG